MRNSNLAIEVKNERKNYTDCCRSAWRNTRYTKKTFKSTSYICKIISDTKKIVIGKITRNKLL